MEYKSENRTCQNCKKDFTIEPDDFSFYEKIKVPPPTFCPDCRRQRRWAWRNNMSLYNRTCDLCKKSIISIYSPSSRIITYCNKCWWSDKWDPKSYGTEYDFSKTFFSQFKKLVGKVPHMAIVNDDGIASLNCQYTHDWWFSKNCYMCFSGWRVENVMYSFHIEAGKNFMDCMSIRTVSEWLYECFITSKCYQIKYSELCLACIDSQFLYDCRDCLNCFMCAGIRGKKYFFQNKQYTKEKYEEILADYRLDTHEGVDKAKKYFDVFLLNYPRKYAQNFQSINCVGDMISYSKNVQKSFVSKRSENSKYGEYFTGDKECYDITLTGESSGCCDSVTVDHSQLNLFGLFSVKSQDIKYCHHCHNCKHCFGCIGLKNASYCIFNKQYSKEEYEELLPKVIKQMDDLPYLDKLGNKYKYGEFYPIELSPFGYNESCAMEINPFSKEEALKKGYKWEDNTQRTTGKETLKPENIPESINEVGDSILDEVLACINCKRNYKIVPNELIFYRKMKIPIPRRCFYCRHEARLKRRNPFKLWHRRCMCEKKHTHQEGHCEVEFETSYAPDRPEIVYCEKCYQQEVY